MNETVLRRCFHTNYGVILLELIFHSLYAVLAKKHGRVQEQIKQAEQNPHQALQEDFPQDFVSQLVVTCFLVCLFFLGPKYCVRVF